MKKLLLSVAVIGAFFVWGLHQKDKAANLRVDPTQLVPPTNTPTVVPITPSVSSAQGKGLTPAPISYGQYKDGSYIGTVEDAFYGNIQVKAVIQGGKIVDVVFLQYPNDRSTSIEINSQAMPYLKQETIAAQSATVDIISGATDSSIAFRRSLAQALAQAH